MGEESVSLSSQLPSVSQGSLWVLPCGAVGCRLGHGPISELQDDLTLDD